MQADLQSQLSSQSRSPCEIFFHNFLGKLLIASLPFCIPFTSGSPWDPTLSINQDHFHLTNWHSSPHKMRRRKWRGWGVGDKSWWCQDFESSGYGQVGSAQSLHPLYNIDFECIAVLPPSVMAQFRSCVTSWQAASAAGTKIKVLAAIGSKRQRVQQQSGSQLQLPLDSLVGEYQASNILAARRFREKEIRESLLELHSAPPLTVQLLWYIYCNCHKSLHPIQIFRCMLQKALEIFKFWEQNFC